MSYQKLRRLAEAAGKLTNRQAFDQEISQAIYNNLELKPQDSVYAAQVTSMFLEMQPPDLIELIKDQPSWQREVARAVQIAKRAEADSERQRGYVSVDDPAGRTAWEKPCARGTFQACTAKGNTEVAFIAGMRRDPRGRPMGELDVMVTRPDGSQVARQITVDPEVALQNIGNHISHLRTLNGETATSFIELVIEQFRNKGMTPYDFAAAYDTSVLCDRVELRDGKISLTGNRLTWKQVADTAHEITPGMSNAAKLLADAPPGWYCIMKFDAQYPKRNAASKRTVLVTNGSFTPLTRRQVGNYLDCAPGSVWESPLNEDFDEGMILGVTTRALDNETPPESYCQVKLKFLDELGKRLQWRSGTYQKMSRLSI